MKIRDWQTGGGYLRGIDVSAYQGNIDFAKVRANGIKFAILRAYGSANSPDQRIVEYAQGFKSVGIPCGSYFFCTISNEYDLNSAREQANKYANKLQEAFGQGKWGDLLPFLDLENNSNVGGRHANLNTTQMLLWVDEFRRTFEATFDQRVKLGLYTNWGFIREHNDFNHAIGGNILLDMPLWIAKWRTTSIPDIGGWDTWAMWQYTDKATPFANGQAVGVSSTDLDMNYVESLDHIRSVYNLSIQDAMATARPIASVTIANTVEVKWVIPPIAGIERLDVWRNGVRQGQLESSTSSWIDTRVEDGKSYTYQIAVVTKNGFTKSESSNIVYTRSEQSGKPNGLYGEAFDRKIILTWQPNLSSEKVRGYSVYLDGKKVGYTEDTTYTFNGLENGKIYKLQVQSHNENPNPSDLSEPLNIAPLKKLPVPPAMLRTKVTENGEIEVTWSYHKDEDFDHFYVVMNRVTLANYLQEERFVIKNVRVDIPHDIYVVAVDKNGDTESSNVRTRTLHQPPQVKGLKGTPLDRKALISWNKPDFYHDPPLPEVPREPLLPQPEGSIYYVVQENDTIDKIADMHGTQFSLVVAWNYHLMEEPLVAGEILYLYVDIPQGTRYHFIQQHDTFAYIEEQYDMPPYELQAFNPDIDPDNLIIGSKIIVRNPTQPVVPTKMEFRKETRTRKIQKVVQETKEVPQTTLITPPISSYEELKEKCLALVGLFETSTGYPDAYGATAGNWDGAGMSFGAIQVNFKSGSLQPVLRAMFDNHTQVVKNAFNFNANPSHYNSLKNCVYNMSRSQQMNWGASISSGNRIVEPYRTYFRNLGTTPECIALQVNAAESYFNNAKNIYNTFGFTSRRAFMLSFDIAIQNGSVSASTRNLVLNDFKTIDPTLPIGIIETQKMVALANRRANASNPRFVEDVRSRKLAIATGTGTVHGIAVNTEDYGLTLDPAFPENEGVYAQPQTTYETITVEKIVEEEIQYEVTIPYIVATQPIPVGEVFVEKEIKLEPPTEIDNYLVYQNDQLVGVLDRDTNSLLVEGLENGVSYDFYIEAVSTQGLEAPDSSTITITPVIDYPNKATDLQAEILDHKTILFSWQLESSPNFSYFEVYLNGKVIVTSTNVLDNTLKYIEAKPNYDYTLEIITYDVDGDFVTSGTIAQRIDIPSVPVGLTAIPKDREVVLTWDHNNEDFVEFYYIYLDGEIHAVVDATENTYKLMGLSNGIMYDFKIQAVSTKGFVSLISDSIFEIPVLDVPNKPKIVYHKELGTGGVELNWEHEKKEGHSHYNIYKDGWLIASEIKENKFMTDHLESNVTHTFQVEAFDFQGDNSGFSESYKVTIYAKILEPLSTNLGKVDKNMPVSKPKIYLCKPNKQVIAHLNEAYGITFTERYADLNELTFNIPYEIQTTTNELIENKHYKMIKERFLIKLEYRERTEYFIINQISNYGENNSKNIHAWSLGYELKDKLITNYKEEIWSAHSAFLFAMDNQLNWRVGANIKNPDFYWNKERRIFSVSNMTILDFIIQVATSFNAILKWDTVNRIIDFENPMIEDVNRGLKIKYGKYLKTLSKSSSVEEMVTHLKPIGENNLTIAKATINGAEYLEDFSYFMQGFHMESEEIADFYINSKAFIKDEFDPYYTNTMGFSSVPKGGVFLTLDSATENVSDIISIETTAKALLTTLELYKTTLNLDYKEKAYLFAYFLVNQKIEAEFEGAKFFILPNNLTYNRTTNLWEKDVDKIYLEKLYIVTSALLEIYKIDNREEYAELILSLTSFLAYAHNNIKYRISSNEIEVGYEGLIYDHMEKIGVNEDGSIKYLFTWNLFNNASLWHFTKTWKSFVELFTNSSRNDLHGEIFIPQDILDTTLNFFNQEYQSGRILMQPTGLPYQYYHYFSPPIAKDDEYFIDEDHVLTISFEEGLIKNDLDFDSENEELTAIITSEPINGTLLLNTNGSFTYTPNLNFYGTDIFKYILNDGHNNSNEATVSIYVNPVNDPPVALNDHYIIDEDTILTTIVSNGVLANDEDVDGDPLTTTLLTSTTNGELIFETNGSFTYTPNPNFYGLDSFTYKLSDGTETDAKQTIAQLTNLTVSELSQQTIEDLMTKNLPTQIATVTIEVINVNDRPTGTNNWYPATEDTVLTVTTANNILKNDNDIDSENLTTVLIRPTQFGTVSLNPDGTFVYTPNLNFVGQDNFIYRVSDGELESENIYVYIDVYAVNDRPIANNNQYTIKENTNLETTANNGVLQDDEDVDSPTLTAILVTSPINGTVTLNSDGSFIYTPNADFFGTDTFTYKANDGTLDSNIATVEIIVENVVELNKFSYTVVSGDTFVIIAEKFSTTTQKIQELNPTVDPMTLYVGQKLILPIPIVDYTAVEGDTFASIAIAHNTTTAYIQELNPTASPMNVYAGLILKVPKVVEGYTFTKISESPTSQADSYITSEDTILNVDQTSGVLANDYDVDSENLTAILITTTVNGTLNLNANGSFTYTPNANFYGQDSFIYKVSDGTNQSENTTVTITINPVIDPQPANTVVYTVKSGDIFADIAWRYGITSTELKAINPDILNVTALYVGQNIYVPAPKVPNVPSSISPLDNGTSNNLTVSATVSHPDNKQVKLIVEASLSSLFTNSVIKESALVNSGTSTSVTISGLNLNSINTKIWLRLKTSDGTLESSTVDSSFTYSVPQPANTFIYTVVSGDTLSKIALANNTTTERILTLNPIVEADNIYVGQQMYLPIAEEETTLTRTYTTEDNDTFSSLAIKFDTTAERIQELNPTIDPMNIYAGLDMIVPLIEYNLGYTIVSGDTVSQIANKYGTTTARIQAVNPTLDINSIWVGQNIVVPIPCEYYTVKSGETIATISVKFTTTIAILTETNANININSLAVGTKVLVPSYPTSEQRDIYTVVSGDTASKIASSLFTTTEIIQTLNPNIDINLIYVGQKLVVPKYVEYSTTYHLLSEEELKTRAMDLTSQYETTSMYPKNYGRTAGDWDEMGLSWGAIQFNAGTGSLIPMWQEMINNHAEVTMKAFTDNPNRTYESNVANFTTWKDLFLRGNFSEIKPWANARTDWSVGGHDVIEPWRTYFYNLGATPEAIAMQIRYAQSYFNNAKNWFYKLGLFSRRAYSLMFDISVQSGSINPKIGTNPDGTGIYRDVIGEINAWWLTVDKTGKTPQELEIMKMEKICEERVKNVKTVYQADWLERKLGIAHGGATVHGLTLNLDDYDLVLEPAFADTVPEGFTEKLAQGFSFDTSQYQEEFGNELTFNTKNIMNQNKYMTEFAGELVPLYELNIHDSAVISPQAKNYDSISDIYGDIWFKTENIFKIALGYADYGLNIIAKDFRTRLSNLKSENHFANNEYVFFDRYNFDGTGNIDGDISKSIINTGLLMQLDNYFEDQIDERIKETIRKYRINSSNLNINNAFRWNVEDNLSNISVKAFNDLVFSFANFKNLGVISSSPYMSDELCKAILSYNRLLDEHQGEYQSLIDERATINEELVDLEYDLLEKETELFIVQGMLDSLKAEGTLFYTAIPYVGQPRIDRYELKKDYTYALLAKTSDNTISLATNSGVQTFGNNNEWTLIEKISYDREGESTVESSIDLYEYSVLFVGEQYADIEIQITRILKQEFEEANNEDELVNKLIEEIHQKNYDDQLVIVEAKRDEIANIDSDLETLRSKLSIYNNFSSELREERDLFIISKEYIDETINNPEDLKNRAIAKFEELKNPTITIEIDVVNFLELIEELYNWNKLQIGTLIQVLYDKFDIEIEAKIIQMEYSFDEKTITLTISNVNDLKTNQEKFIDAIYGAVSTSTTVSLEKHAWSKGMEVREDLDSFMNQAFDATKQKIIAGTNESVEISHRGMLIKSDTDPLNFLIANSAVLAITNDGGKSYKNAITSEGVVAERLFGQIIAGENLIIENKAGNFRVDSEGVTIEGQGLTITGGITNEHLSDDFKIDVDIDFSGLSSFYEDTFEENNQNTTIPTSPTIIEDGTHVQHSDVTFDLVDISFNWEYSDEQIPETEIDGFMIYIFTSNSSSLYTFGTKKKAEIAFYVKPNKRSIILNNVPKDLFYNFGIEAYRFVDIELNIESVFTSPIIQISAPYNPSNNVAYDGNIMGTVNYNNVAKVNGDIVTAIRQGQSYSNVTIDPNNGIISENNSKTQRVIMNEEGFRLQKKIIDRYEDILYADSEGTLVAEDLVANRLVVNDGSGRELINAHTKQINFDEFDVVTGNIHADNIDMKGMQVLRTSDGLETFTIDNDGNVTIRGNVTMYGGSILWDQIDKPTYTANEVGARPNDWFPTASEVGARPSSWTPTYLEIGGTKPPSDANNTFNELVTNPKINGFYADAYGNLYINATYIKSGEIDASQIHVRNLDAGDIKTGTLTGVSIDVKKDVRVGAELTLRYNVENKTTARLSFYDYWNEQYGTFPANYIEKSANSQSLLIHSANDVTIDVTDRFFLGYRADTHYYVSGYPSDDGESGWYTARKEKGVCGIGAVNSLESGFVIGTYVNFRMKKYNYVPLNPNLQATSSTTNAKFADVSKYGFWLYIQEAWSTIAYRYWRGYYNC